MAWFGKKSSPRPECPPLEQESGTRISSILAGGAIKVGMEAGDKDEAMEELVELLVQTGGIKDREAALAALREREALGSTGIGDGLAFPHGKHKTIEKLVAAMGISRGGVDFDSADGKPANIVFLLLARMDNPGPHVRALAAIAHLLKQPGFCHRLLEAASSAEVLDIIRSEE